MTKILVIAPYKKFADMFRDVFETHRENVHMDDEEPDKYELEVIVEYNQDRFPKMNLECDVLIARGFSATLLKQGHEYLPVVEIPVLPYDIIRNLKRAKELYGPKKIYFPGTPNITAHAKYLAEIVDLDIEIIDMPSTMGREPEIAFAKIPDRDCIVIGGMPVCALAEQMAIPNIMIETGPEAMHSALSEAKRLAYVRRKERERSHSFKTILDCYVDGVVAFNRNNRFTSINSMAETILGISAQKALGRTMEEVFPNTQLTEILSRDSDCVDEVIRFNHIPLAVNKTGILFENKRIGSVVTIQYVTKIQNTEKNIRNKIMERGLIAKHSFPDIQGKSAEISAAVLTARKYSGVDSNVLITGKSGTGKELFAQSIHNEGPQRNAPFVAINCAAIPENLLESELFGYVEGAFTGASKDGKPGLIELAHKGTLFLDEISELPIRLQGRLLRVLQEREIMRLGSDKVTRVSIRVISATNRDLLELVEAKRFREDLYYRLAVLPLKLPDLNDRCEDIADLARLFLTTQAARINRSPLSISDEALELLGRLHWRGNIRELKNACEQLAVLTEGDDITVDAVETILAEKFAANTDPSPLHLPEKAFSRESVERFLREGYSRRAIAERLGIDRTTLWRKMRSWDMQQK